MDLRDQATRLWELADHVAESRLSTQRHGYEKAEVDALRAEVVNEVRRAVIQLDTSEATIRQRLDELAEAEAISRGRLRAVIDRLHRLGMGNVLLSIEQAEISAARGRMGRASPLPQRKRA